MGLDVTGYVVFGKVVSENVIMDSTKARSCPHKTDESKPFCSECGKPVFVERQTRLLESLNREGLSYFYSDHANTKEILVGFMLSSTYQYYSSEHKQFNPIKKPTAAMVSELLDFFADRKIPVKESDFAEHLMLYYSY